MVTSYVLEPTCDVLEGFTLKECSIPFLGMRLLELDALCSSGMHDDVIE